MLFNSIDFLIFFPVVTGLYFLTPHRFRWLLLLLASCFFYVAFIPAYIFVLFLAIFIDYWAAIFIERSNGKSKKLYLIISILSTVLLLFFFKYFNFIHFNFILLSQKAGLAYSLSDNLLTPLKPFLNKYGICKTESSGFIDLLLPIGLSFHTFQSLAYVMEVYYGRYKAEHHFGIYSLYVMFYPQLVAGPIERPYNLLKQIREVKKYDHSRFIDGLKLMFWGMFKKVVIADRLAMFVAPVFNHPEDYYGWRIILTSVLLHIQVYNDLSGYTDIARGAARVMGFNLMKNFNSPLFSTSIFDFWKRWHISLTSWFRDYLYIPLGGNRVGKWRWYYNIFIVFFISGLWHGANWTFIIWGVLHGTYQLVEIWTDKPRHKLFEITRLTKFPVLLKTLGIITTTLLISFATLFFGARSIHDSFVLIRHAAFISDTGNILSLFANNDFILALLLIVFLYVTEYFNSKYRLVPWLGKKPVLIRWSVYIAAVLFITIFGVFGELEFIYFQF
ncbi:MAG: MBOAT family protein [Bacteroidia bacterium]|nr:MBOAT family protein [Bacteroidia bacterium]